MKIQKTSKKVICLVIAIVMLLNTFAFPIATVFANTNLPILVLQTKDDSTISIDDIDTNKLLYTQENMVIGTAKVKLYNTDGDYVTPVIQNGNAEFELPEYQENGYRVIVEVSPAEGYSRGVNYSFKGDSVPFSGDNIVGLDITDNSVQTMYFEFNPNGNFQHNDPEQPIIRMDFTINGESFTNIEFNDINKTIQVSDDFNVETLTEFYVTRIEIEGVRTYEYLPGEYSLELLDDQNRTIFDSRFTKVSDNMARIRVESHSNDILDKDIAKGKTRDDYYGFYITNIDFIKNDFKGIEVSTGVMPDNYDFTSWNGVDLGGTSESNPAKATVYYGEDTINFESIVSSEISEISLINDSTIPSNAVEIDNSLGQVKILSNYYNNIPLKIKLADGTVGYINISRIGIFITDLNAGQDTLYHGASSMVSNNFNIDTDKNRIGAIFYHEDSTTYEDYDLIVNMTYVDGTTETTIAKGVGDVHNSSGNITGSDYLLWKDDGQKTPLKVSVTVVKKDALTNENTFGGAKFGSGAGIEWEYRR